MAMTQIDHGYNARIHGDHGAATVTVNFRDRSFTVHERTTNGWRVDSVAYWPMDGGVDAIDSARQQAVFDAQTICRGG